jgi:NADPH-dependent ferric siderophore reductase
MTRTRRIPKRHIMLAGDVDDLAEIESILASESVTAYGQVYIECTTPGQIRPVAAPPRVTVQWLERCTRQSALEPLVFADRGESLAHAIVGWAGEWSEAPCDRMWIGCDGSPWVLGALEALSARLSTAR